MKADTLRNISTHNNYILNGKLSFYAGLGNKVSTDENYLIHTESRKKLK